MLPCPAAAGGAADGAADAAADAAATAGVKSLLSTVCHDWRPNNIRP